MDDRHQVLNHLALGREFFLIKDEYLTTVSRTKMLEQIKTKAREAISVSNNEMRDLPLDDPIYDCKEVLSLEVEASSNFRNMLHICKTATHTKVIQYGPLILEIWPLRLRRNPIVRDDRAWGVGDGQTQVPIEIGLQPVTTPCRRSPRRK